MDKEIVGKPITRKESLDIAMKTIKNAENERVENSMLFTDQKPRIATEEDCKANWSGHKNGAWFKCTLCGHKFIVGDYWRWIYGKGYLNFIVCRCCDSGNVEEIWVDINKKWEEMRENGPFWRFIQMLEDSYG